MTSSATGLRVAVSQQVFPACTRHLVRALQQRGALDTFYTAVLDHPDSGVTRRAKRALRRIGGGAVARQIERRTFAEVDFGRVRQRPRYMLPRLAAARVPRLDGLTDWLWEHGDHDFDRWVARHLAPRLDAVVAEEHAALATLRRARALGTLGVLEQVSLHHCQFTAILEEQLRRYPDLRSGLTDLYQSPATVRRDARRDAELRAADAVLCHSEVTKRSLVAAGADAGRIDVVPLGFPAPAPRTPPGPGPLRFLYAGSQSVRKGTHLLLEAWRGLDLPDAELHLVGSNGLPERWRQGLPGRVAFSGHIPQPDLFALYRQAGVFVFPTLSDGFAMVVAEAMAMGLPVITTEAAGAADLIEHGRTGFVVPAGDVEALRAQMAWCADNRDRLDAVGAAAVETARAWPWARYESGVVAAIERRVAVVAAHAARWASEADAAFAGRPWTSRIVRFGAEASPAVRRWTSLRHRLAREAAARIGPGRAPDALLARAAHYVTPGLARASTPADLYIAHNLGALPAAAAAARRHGARLGFDAEDFHRGETADTPEHAAQRALVAAIEDRFLPRCNYVTAASDGIARAYADATGIARPATVLNVFPRADRDAPVDAAALAAEVPPGARSLHWFSQTIGPGRGLEGAVRALALLPADVVLTLRGGWAGGYEADLRALAAREGVGARVRALGHCPPGEVVRRAAEHDVGLALEVPATVNRDICVTNKLFTYLLAGLPTAASATAGQRAVCAGLAEATCLYPPGDAEALAAGILRLLADPSAQAAADRAGRERYCWDVEQRVFLGAVADALAPAVPERRL